MSTSTSTSTHTITLPDGRQVSVDEVGDAAGPVVVLLHSSPGSRALDPDPAATAAAGIRLISIDRAGYGGSTPLPADVVPTLAQAADDVVAVLDHLEAADAAVVGWSHGGRVAGALAARHPERVRTMALVGTPSPDDLSFVPAEHQAMLDALRPEPRTATAQLAGILGAAVGDDAAEALPFLAGEGDEPLLADGAVRERVVTMLAEAFAQGAVGCATDIVSDQIAPWGFDPRSIGAPVHLVYSEDDVVNPQHGDWWAERLVDVTRHTTRDVGHLLVIPMWATILDALAG